MEKNGNEGKKHKRGKPPVIIPKKVNDWIRDNGTNPYVQTFRTGKLK